MNYGEPKTARNPRVLILGALESDLPRAPPFNHESVDTAHDADAVYLWVPRSTESTRELGLAQQRLPMLMFKLGQVQALFKPLYIGSKDAPLALPFESEMQLRVIKRKQGIGPRNAYELLMADLDVTLPKEETVEYRNVAFNGHCSGCGGAYAKLDSVAHVMNAEGHRVYHVDCHARLKDPRAINAAIFHSGLVEALRVDNAKLEAELETLKEKSRAHH